jgi:hypothetical protein
MSCRTVEIDVWDSDDGKSIMVAHAKDTAVKRFVVSSTTLDFRSVVCHPRED